MPRLRTSVGQLLVNEALPPDLRRYDRQLDKQGQAELLRAIAEKYPDQYRQISHQLANLGQLVAYRTGGYSFGLKDLRQLPSAKLARAQLQAEINKLDDDDSLSDDAREAKILQITDKLSVAQTGPIYDEAVAAGNPIAMQVLSGARGKPSNLVALVASDLLYTDHRDRLIPLPIMRSYSQGLTPAEYFAASFGARRGLIGTKLGVADAGWLGKRLGQAAHRLLVTGLDSNEEPATLRGLPVSIDDPDNAGSLLAAPAGPYPRNTPLTPKILSELSRRGVKRLLVRSPITGGPADGGVYARDVGVREEGGLPTTGNQVGITAAQALSEGISQASLGSKHGGGAVGSGGISLSGFKAVDQTIQVPETFRGGGVHADADGSVDSVRPAATGGFDVMINNVKHHVPVGRTLNVKPGDHVEAGDLITDGLPNPAAIVKHKGIGEGRRYFIGAFQDAVRSAGQRANRRNVELLARGLIDHVRLTDERGDNGPDDVVPYREIEHSWTPRDGAEERDPRASIGRYLEQPYLHYSIGTKIRPSMLANFKEFGVPRVLVHAEPPPFEPVMIRSADNLNHDPDWMTQLYGSNAKRNFLTAVHKGRASDEQGTSFVPGLAKGIDFGRKGLVQNRSMDVHGPSMDLPKAAAAPAPVPAAAPAPPAPPAQPAIPPEVAAVQDRAMKVFQTLPPQLQQAAPELRDTWKAHRETLTEQAKSHQKEIATLTQKRLDLGPVPHEEIRPGAEASRNFMQQVEYFNKQRNHLHAEFKQLMAANVPQASPQWQQHMAKSNKLQQWWSTVKAPDYEAPQQHPVAARDAELAKTIADRSNDVSTAREETHHIDRSLKQIAPYAGFVEKMRRMGPGGVADFVPGNEHFTGDLSLDTYADFVESAMSKDIPGYQYAGPPPLDKFQQQAGHVGLPTNRDPNQLGLDEQLAYLQDAAKSRGERFERTGYMPEDDQRRQQAAESPWNAAPSSELAAVRGLGDTVQGGVRLGLRGLDMAGALPDGMKDRAFANMDATRNQFGDVTDYAAQQQGAEGNWQNTAGQMIGGELPFLPTLPFGMAGAIPGIATAGETLLGHDQQSPLLNPTGAQEQLQQAQGLGLTASQQQPNFLDLARQYSEAARQQLPPTPAYTPPEAPKPPMAPAAPLAPKAPRPHLPIPASGDYAEAPTAAGHHMLRNLFPKL